MCLSTVYELGAAGDKRLLCEYTSNVTVAGDTITMTDLMGKRLQVTGALQSVDLVKNTILIRPKEGANPAASSSACPLPQHKDNACIIPGERLE
jgi:predicted RNA-binding protein